MYIHNLFIQQREVLPSEELNDNVFKHIVYTYITSLLNEENKIVESKSQHGVVYLDEPDPSNFIPCDQVTQEKLQEWIEAKVDIDALKAQNLSEFGA